MSPPPEWIEGVVLVMETERRLVCISERGEFVVTALDPGKRERFGVGGFEAIGFGCVKLAFGFGGEFCELPVFGRD